MLKEEFVKYLVCQYVGWNTGKHTYKQTEDLTRSDASGIRPLAVFCRHNNANVCLPAINAGRLNLKGYKPFRFYNIF